MVLKVGITMGINNQSDKNRIKRDMEELREVLNEICAMEEGSKIIEKKTDFKSALRPTYCCIYE